MTPDEICERYSIKNVGLSLKILSDGEADPNPLILIEGTKDALKMLSEIIAAVAEDSKGDGFSISPNGAGSIHFDKTSDYGIYIHRLI